jgi:hypothetical protein
MTMMKVCVPGKGSDERARQPNKRRIPMNKATMMALPLIAALMACAVNEAPGEADNAGVEEHLGSEEHVGSATQALVLDTDSVGRQRYGVQSLAFERVPDVQEIVPRVGALADDEPSCGWSCLEEWSGCRGYARNPGEACWCDNFLRACLNGCDRGGRPFRYCEGEL